MPSKANQKISQKEKRRLDVARQKQKWLLTLWLPVSLIVLTLIGLAVHALEHGAVWLAYHTDLPPEKVEALRDLVRGKSYTLMSPYPDLAADVVMSAWSRQLVIESFPDERVVDFITRYRQQGPEPGAPCTGGVGVPVQ